jgi:MoxR-like ATPase
MGYPNARDEAAMLKAHGVEPPVVRPMLSPADVQTMQAISARIHVEDDLHDYAVGITTFTRSHPRVALGASPRATLALVQASKAWALLNGRTYVVPDDMRAVAPAVIAHRIVLTADTEPDAKAREQVVEEALAKVSYRRGVRAV